jgi:D-arabinose 1-dehydrogenase-like Zn-dependent alcohol dehydrogenase
VADCDVVGAEPLASVTKEVVLFNSVSCVVRCHIKAGEILLVHGASGAVGIAAVQIAKAYGKRRHLFKSNVWLRDVGEFTLLRSGPSPD